MRETAVKLHNSFSPAHSRAINRHMLPFCSVEEILRLHGPLISNRRTAVRPVVIGGRRIEAGERMTVIWTSANRDARAFEAADRYCPERDQGPNLLYGAGIHICPGAALARMQLRVMIDELRSAIRPFSVLTGTEPFRAVYPASGFASVFLQIAL
ncbi:MAG: cytochrome P450 [Arenimonas sp.]|nr:cytochrome P450 [Rhizobium sp.]MBW8445242.1 cytochrome P450 [Arenimonas sp.]